MSTEPSGTSVSTSPETISCSRRARWAPRRWMPTSASRPSGFFSTISWAIRTSVRRMSSRSRTTVSCWSIACSFLASLDPVKSALRNIHLGRTARFCDGYEKVTPSDLFVPDGFTRACGGGSSRRRELAAAGRAGGGRSRRRRAFAAGVRGGGGRSRRAFAAAAGVRGGRSRRRRAFAAGVRGGGGRSRRRAAPASLGERLALAVLPADEAGGAALGVGDLDRVEVARENGVGEDGAGLVAQQAERVPGGEVGEREHPRLGVAGDLGGLASGRVAVL